MHTPPQVNNDREYPKKVCSMCSYLIQIIPAEQNVFLLKKQKKKQEIY